jgi:hypothetical protein
MKMYNPSQNSTRQVTPGRNSNPVREQPSRPPPLMQQLLTGVDLSAQQVANLQSQNEHLNKEIVDIQSGTNLDLLSKICRHDRYTDSFELLKSLSNMNEANSIDHPEDSLRTKCCTIEIQTTDYNHGMSLNSTSTRTLTLDSGQNFDINYTPESRRPFNIKKKESTGNSQQKHQKQQDLKHRSPRANPKANQPVTVAPLEQPKNSTSSTRSSSSILFPILNQIESDFSAK